MAPPIATIRRLRRELRVPAAARELARVREFAAAAAAHFGLDERDGFRFKLAASEAAANAIEHGAPRGDGTICLRVEREGQYLVLYVEDGGSFATPARTPEELSERGRGLAFIAALMDEMEITFPRGGTLVRLAKRLPAGA